MLPVGSALLASNVSTQNLGSKSLSSLIQSKNCINNAACEDAGGRWQWGTRRFVRVVIKQCGCVDAVSHYCRCGDE
jgi:hypothetical protein